MGKQFEYQTSKRISKWPVNMRKWWTALIIREKQIKTTVLHTSSNMTMVLSKVWINAAFHPLLVWLNWYNHFGILFGIPVKVDHTDTSCIHGFKPKRNAYICSPGDVFKVVLGSTVHTSPQTETTQMPVSNKMDKWNVAYLFNGIPCSN